MEDAFGLTRNERIRLEALNQSVASSDEASTTQGIVERAQHFETWIKEGKLPYDNKGSGKTRRVQ